MSGGGKFPKVLLFAARTPFFFLCNWMHRASQPHLNGNFMKYSFKYLLFILMTAVSLQAQTISANSASCQEEKAKNEHYEMQLKDWANLNRYRAANVKLAPPAKNETRIVFMGDSITDGWNLAQYFPGESYVNRGIGGQTTPQMLLRFRADVIELKPKVVVILAGTNDIAGNTGLMTLEDTAHNVVSMVELARANKIRVILSSVLPVNDRSRNGNGTFLIQTKSRPNETIRAMNEWLKKYAAQSDSVYLDYYSATVGSDGNLKDNISDDGLHPNAEGYRIMQSLAKAAIERAIKR